MASLIDNIIVGIKKEKEYNKVVEKVVNIRRPAPLTLILLPNLIKLLTFYLILPPKSMTSILLIFSLISLLISVVFIPITLKFSITTLQTQT